MGWSLKFNSIRPIDAKTRIGAMNPSRSKSGAANFEESSDQRLVEACLAGSEDAWSALVQRYARLIYSVPVKNGFSQDEAADIFQQVCLKLLESLPDLRRPESLASWLIRVTTHLCIRAAGQRRSLEFGDVEREYADIPDQARLPDALIRDVEREQMIRQALLDMKPRCRELIRLLFLETPAAPYEEVAKLMGLAKGSIGFIRMRCLSTLRRRLEQLGFL
jgi:RNA polymerase sigma factor (sigma-70 family)